MPRKYPISVVKRPKRHMYACAALPSVHVLAGAGGQHFDRVESSQQVDSVTFEESAIAASALVLHLHTPCVRADVCQVRNC